MVDGMAGAGDTGLSWRETAAKSLAPVVELQWATEVESLAGVDKVSTKGVCKGVLSLFVLATVGASNRVANFAPTVSAAYTPLAQNLGGGVNKGGGHVLGV